MRGWVGGWVRGGKGCGWVGEGGRVKGAGRGGLGQHSSVCGVCTRHWKGGDEWHPLGVQGKV